MSEKSRTIWLGLLLLMVSLQVSLEGAPVFSLPLPAIGKSTGGVDMPASAPEAVPERLLLSRQGGVGTAPAVRTARPVAFPASTGVMTSPPAARRPYFLLHHQLIFYDRTDRGRIR